MFAEFLLSVISAIFSAAVVASSDDPIASAAIAEAVIADAVMVETLTFCLMVPQRAPLPN